MTRTSQLGWWLLAVTVALVTVAGFLWALDWTLWAQLLLVLASGAAGGCVALFVERRR